MADGDLASIQEPSPGDELQAAGARLTIERQDLENDRLREELFRQEEDRRFRRRMTGLITGVALIWLAGVFTIVFMHGFAGGAPSDQETWFRLPTFALVALVGTPGASVAGLIVWVVRSVFPGGQP